MTKKVRLAKEMLFNLIEKGVEYPTAHERVCLKFDLSDSEAIDLTEQYDSHCEKPYKNSIECMDEDGRYLNYFSEGRIR